MEDDTDRATSAGDDSIAHGVNDAATQTDLSTPEMKSPALRPTTLEGAIAELQVLTADRLSLEKKDANLRIELARAKHRESEQAIQLADLQQRLVNQETRAHHEEMLRVMVTMDLEQAHRNLNTANFGRGEVARLRREIVRRENDAARDMRNVTIQVERLKRENVQLQNDSLQFRNSTVRESDDANAQIMKLRRECDRLKGDAALDKHKAMEKLASLEQENALLGAKVEDLTVRAARSQTEIEILTESNEEEKRRLHELAAADAALQVRHKRAQEQARGFLVKYNQLVVLVRKLTDKDCANLVAENLGIDDLVLLQYSSRYNLDNDHHWQPPSYDQVQLREVPLDRLPSSPLLADEYIYSHTVGKTAEYGWQVVVDNSMLIQLAKEPSKFDSGVEGCEALKMIIALQNSLECAFAGQTPISDSTVNLALFVLQKLSHNEYSVASCIAPTNLPDLDFNPTTTSPFKPRWRTHIFGGYSILTDIVDQRYTACIPALGDASDEAKGSPNARHEAGYGLCSLPSTTLTTFVDDLDSIVGTKLPSGQTVDRVETPDATFWLVRALTGLGKTFLALRKDHSSGRTTGLLGTPRVTEDDGTFSLTWADVCLQVHSEQLSEGMLDYLTRGTGSNGYRYGYDEGRRRRFFLKSLN
ncbi:hypothetical protein BDZ85DRAFT_285268 [Elsinoe ampelina]|uniref:Uncharacterized protein n=1 Tax=Elsinoe ampelina TaxID=302913 RepID=A0A6A6G1A7_9PEZI|nr:hypothetical protein BDZ85DRAFT_285268 [Elsinoe ampelina]